MTPYKQLNLHRPDDGEIGDCYRTSIGCLLDMPPEDVPHFAEEADLRDKGDVSGDTLAQRWLIQRGLALFSVAYIGDASLDEMLEMQEMLNPNVFYIFSGQSVEGRNHSVVALGGKIIHDPSRHPKDPVLSGPCTDGNWWIDVITNTVSEENSNVD